MKGEKIDENTPPLLYNENLPNEPVDASLITPLKSYHDNHPLKEGRAYKLLGILSRWAFKFKLSHRTPCQ